MTAKKRTGKKKLTEYERRVAKIQKKIVELNALCDAGYVNMYAMIDRTLGGLTFNLNKKELAEVKQARFKFKDRFNDIQYIFGLTGIGQYCYVRKYRPRADDEVDVTDYESW